MSSETVVISLATSLHLYINRCDLFNFFLSLFVVLSRQITLQN